MIPLTEKYKPKRLADFAGLAGPRAVLSRFAAEPYSAAWLLVGDAGTGKTTMAFALAEEVSGEVHHIPSRSCDLEAVERICASCHYFPWAGKWHVVIVDEADQMSRPAQLAFLSKLDSTAPPPNTIFVFTANDTALLEKRFISRTRVLRFDGHQVADGGADFLAGIWKREASDRAAIDFAELLKRNEYNLRACLNDLEMELLAPGYIRKPELVAEPETRHHAAAPVVSIDNLDHLGVRALRTLCKQHGVPIASRKSDVVNRLRLAVACA